MTPRSACRPDGFTRRATAARRAWLMRQDGRDAEPVHCDRCGMWHIRASPRTTRPEGA